MTLRFASIGSGSKGNCLVAEVGSTRVLLDCGLSPRETERRLARIGLTPADISGILVTHEHDDHAGQAYPFAALHKLPVWLTHGTQAAMADSGKLPGEVETRTILGREAFAIGDLEVRPYTVPHDAREPVQFVLSDGAFRLGVLTDIGASTAPGAGSASRSTASASRSRIGTVRRASTSSATPIPTRWCWSATTTTTCCGAASIRNG